MAARRKAKRVVQAWIELLADDPEAMSALSVARAQLSGGVSLEHLRRVRLFELHGPLPSRREMESLLHGSIQFYNPHKERCVIRESAEDPAPVALDERVVLVWERGGERRTGAERWWLHETGKRIEVREGTAWIARFAPEARSAPPLDGLLGLLDRQHGLLCNPHSQECQVAQSEAPIPWWNAATQEREA
jgi:hypothetical protein